MSNYILAFKPAIDRFGVHDPSAAIFVDGELVFAVEEERFTRQKHAENTFPRNAIEVSLDYCNITLPEVDRILLPYDPELESNLLLHRLKRGFSNHESIAYKLGSFAYSAKEWISTQYFSNTRQVETELSRIGEPVPEIETLEHHACHAASAFYPASFDDGLVLTVDGKGEYDSTVVWQGKGTNLERVATYEFPNSLGQFYATITEYLGYRAFNGEGKIMGLAPYGSSNPEIEQMLSSEVQAGVDYDVTNVTENGIDRGVDRLEALFDRPRKDEDGEFDQWEKDLAFAAQQFLEKTVCALVSEYCAKFNTNNVGLAGGVALNCKLNKCVMELEPVENQFIQPIAHDAGLAIGAGLEAIPNSEVDMSTVYWGPEYSRSDVQKVLETNKIEYSQPDDLVAVVADYLADGQLVGWYQGRLEMGPRALGNRSILADPRTEASRDYVNRYVKNREEWRPFAPSMLADRADDYLENAEESSYMIKTFDVKASKAGEISAVLHPADDTTRPQTVRQDQNPRYYELIKQFESITGVPVLLNTSFNDHGEPIVTTPGEALKDFYGMGLDVLVLEDALIEK